MQPQRLPLFCATLFFPFHKREVHIGRPTTHEVGFALGVYYVYFFAAFPAAEAGLSLPGPLPERPTPDRPSPSRSSAALNDTWLSRAARGPPPSPAGPAVGPREALRPSQGLCDRQWLRDWYQHHDVRPGPADKLLWCGGGPLRCLGRGVWAAQGGAIPYLDRCHRAGRSRSSGSCWGGSAWRRGWGCGRRRRGVWPSPGSGPAHPPAFP